MLSVPSAAPRPVAERGTRDIVESDGLEGNAVGIFKRGAKDTREPGGLFAIPAFWQWWLSNGRPLADQGTLGGDWGNFADEVSARVARIHPDLEWETAAGVTAKHALIITSGGISERRSLAERCFRAAPPADATWEYHPARQSDPKALTSRLELDGSELDLSLARVGLTLHAERQKADVSIFHPGFANIPEQTRGQATYLILDWLLGEDGVERWIGAVEAVTICPADALPADALPETVLALAARTGDDHWALLEGQRDGKPVLVSAMRPMKWIDNPLLDQHLEVLLPFVEQSERGYPQGVALKQLRQLEDQLTAQCGDRALLVAHETHDGARTLHLYVDHTDQSILGIAQQVAATWPSARVRAELDPGWKSVSDFG
jgi:hypothetical protein